MPEVCPEIGNKYKLHWYCDHSSHQHSSSEPLMPHVIQYDKVIIFKKGSEFKLQISWLRAKRSRTLSYHGSLKLRYFVWKLLKCQFQMNKNKFATNPIEKPSAPSLSFSLSLFCSSWNCNKFSSFQKNQQAFCKCVWTIMVPNEQ